MYKIDLNSDLAEGFGAYTIGNDSAIIPLISSANIACGFHAGDPDTMKAAALLCRDSSTAVGAHPGYRDLQGFGRRSIDMSAQQVETLITYQLGALDAFCRSNNVRLEHVKPHGALYNAAAKDERLAEAICTAVYNFNSELILLGLSGSMMLKKAKELSLPCASEVFADRAYEDDGSLVARGKPGAVIKDEDEAVRRVVDMIKNGAVKSINGKYIDIEPHSVCVHSDSEKALLFVKKLLDAFSQNEVEVCPLRKIVK